MRLALALLIVCTASVAVLAQEETSEELANSTQDLFLSDDDTIVYAATRSRGGGASRPSSSSSRPPSSSSRPPSSSSRPPSSSSRPGNGPSNPFRGPNSGSNPSSKPNLSPNPRPSVNTPKNPKPNVNPDPKRKPTEPTNPKDKNQGPSKSDKGKNQNGGADSSGQSGSGQSGGGPSGGGSSGGGMPSLPDIGGLISGLIGSGGNPSPNQGTNPYNDGASTGGNQYSPNSNPNPDQAASGSGTFPYFSQSDPRWSNERIGKTTQSIGSGGSVITSLAMLLGGFNLRIGDQTSSPRALNQYLTQSQGYSGNGEVNWNALKNLGFETVGPFESFDAVIQRMSSGNYCILNVGKHWVLATGISGDNYDVMDPQNQSNKTYPSKQASVARCFVRT